MRRDGAGGEGGRVMASPHTTRTRVSPHIRHDDRPLSQRGIRQPTLISAEDKATVRFNAYMAAHPEIYAGFRTLALRLYNAGVRHYGGKAIVEVLRYETIIRARGEPFKIDNNVTSRLARLLAANDYRFKDFFSFRELKPGKGRKVTRP